MKKFRNKIELCLALALINACSACTGTPAAKRAQYDRVKCEVQALEPLALYDADYAVREIESGGLSLEQLISGPALVKQNVDTVKAAFSACRAQYPKPVADAGAGG